MSENEPIPVNRYYHKLMEEIEEFENDMIKASGYPLRVSASGQAFKKARVKYVQELWRKHNEKD